MDVGTELRRARERRGISLVQVADRTKIPGSILGAIERNDFDSLPGGLFTRGYLRAVAREVGIDPEEVVRRFKVEFEPPPPVEAAEDEAVEVNLGRVSEPVMANLERLEARGQWLGSAVVVMVGALVYFMLARDVPRRDMDPAVHDGNPAVAQDIQPVGTGGAELGAVPVSLAVQSPNALRVEIQPQGPCWIGATVDGRLSIQRLLNAGERETMDVTEGVVLRVGDAAACGFSINGSPARVNGGAGQAVTLHITKQNYRELLGT